MQLLKQISSTITRILILFFLLGFCVLVSSSPTYAQSKAKLTQAEINGIYNSDCPETVKATLRYAEAQNGSIFSTGTYITAVYPDGRQITLSCSSFKEIQSYLIRIIGILITFIPFVFVFSIVKSLIIIMTGDEKGVEEGVQGIRGSITSLMFTIFGYFGIVFILVGIFGLGTPTGKPEYNLICQQQLVFTLTFSNSIDPCANKQITPP